MIVATSVTQRSIATDPVAFMGIRLYYKLGEASKFFFEGGSVREVGVVDCSCRKRRFDKMFHPGRCSPNGAFKNDAFSRFSCSTLFTVKAWYTMSISYAATGVMLRSKKRRTIELDRRCGSFDSHCSQCFLASFLYLRCKLWPLHGMSSSRYEHPSMHLACVPDIISIGWCTSLPSRLNPTASAFETWDSVTVVRKLAKSRCTWSLLFLWTTKCLFVETFSQGFQPQKSRRIGLSSTKKRGLDCFSIPAQ